MHIRPLLCVTLLPIPAAVAQCNPAWQHIAPLPSSRTNAAMAYDSARQRLVLFGGAQSGTPSSNTYEFDGAQWQLMPIAAPPPARQGHAMVYDASRGVMVLYGGRLGNGQYTKTTFEYNGVAWTERSPVFSPAAREQHAMAYDTDRHVVVMYGGILSGSATSSDIYEYDGTNWAIIHVTTPGMRFGHAMTYDQQRHVTVMFGGIAGPPSASTYSTLTWEWDGTAWSVFSGSSPPARAFPCLAYNPVRHTTLLFGGENNSQLISTLWEFNGAAWQNITPQPAPGARSAPAFAYDNLNSRLLVVGGMGISGPFTDAWSLGSAGVPGVTAHPSPQQRATSQQVSFSAAATQATSWQWLKNNQPLSNNGRTAGVTTPTLTINSLVESDAGVYKAVVTNTCGSTTTNPATLTVTPVCGTSDFDGDGDLGTDADIEAFFACLSGDCCAACVGADFNFDGDTGTDADIEAFFRVLGGGNC